MFCVRQYDSDRKAYSRVVADFPEYQHARRFCEEVLFAKQIEFSPGAFRSTIKNDINKCYEYENYAIYYYA